MRRITAITNRYIAECNRVVRDNIRFVAKWLTKHGLYTTILPHKTALSIERPKTMSWKDFTRLIRAVLQPRRGSIMLSSSATGRTFICNNSGNRPGQFVLV